MWEAGTGLITIAGGKLTGYRKMAEAVVNLVVKRLKSKSFGPSVTEYFPLSGGDFGGIEKYKPFVRSKAFEAILYGLSFDEGERLASFYGTNVDAVFSFAHALNGQDSSDLPLSMKAEILYSVHHEMVMTPSDYFIRRTGNLYFNIQLVEKYKEAVSHYLGHLLSHTEHEKYSFLQELEKHISEAKVKDGAYQ